MKTVNHFFLQARLKIVIFLWLTCYSFSAPGENSYFECYSALHSQLSESQICALALHQDDTIKTLFLWGVLQVPKTTETYRIQYLYSTLHYIDDKIQTYYVTNPPGFRFGDIPYYKLPIVRVPTEYTYYDGLKLYFREVNSKETNFSIHSLGGRLTTKRVDPTLRQLLSYNERIMGLGTHLIQQTSIMQRTLLCPYPNTPSIQQPVRALCYFSERNRFQMEPEAQDLPEVPPQSILNQMMINFKQYDGF